MTVRQNMGFALKLRRMARADIKSRVADTAGMLGIEGLLSRRPRQLSGGQRQRVALGRAIVREPKAFLFDEPLSNLDAALRVSTRAELKRLHMRLGTTTIHVTHDQEEAMTLGERIVVMADGKIHQIGPPMEVFDNPANRFVATFIGMPPMNMIEGRLERRDGSLVFAEHADAASAWSVELPARLHPNAEAGERVAIGIRAQALHPGTEGAVLTTDVEVVEPLGDQADAIGRTPGGHRIVARCPSRTRPEPGTRASWSIDWSGVHLFGEDGSRLSGAVES